jgi:hypothetical protein
VSDNTNIAGDRTENTLFNMGKGLKIDATNLQINHQNEFFKLIDWLEKLEKRIEGENAK